MAKPLVDDELWELSQPLLPPPKPRRWRYPGRKPLPDRQALTGILFVLKSGIPWEMLPQEMGCGSGMSCWRRLRDWQEAGVWQQLHELLLAKLRQRDRIDWSRAVVDSASIRDPVAAPSGGHSTGSGPAEPPSPETGPGSGRPSLSLGTPQKGTALAEDRAGLGSALHRARQRLGNLPLGG